MDDRAAMTYMGTVRVLLLLSALLSALTGVGSGAARLHAAPAVAERTIGRSVVAAAAVLAPFRQSLPLPSLRAAAGPVLAGLLVVPAFPLWANRRRE